MGILRKCQYIKSGSVYEMLFHCFGTRPIEGYDTPLTVAILEDETGEILYASPDNIKFIPNDMKK